MHGDEIYHTINGTSPQPHAIIVTRIGHQRVFQEQMKKTTRFTSSEGTTK